MNDQPLTDCWTMFQREHNSISVDRMVCDPKLRKEFLDQVRGVFPEDDEQTVLWTLMGLRKGKKLSKNSSI